MKLSRAAFLASIGALILTAGVAVARPGNGGGGGNGHGRPDRKPKVVVNGVVVSVAADSFVLHKRGGRGNGRRGADVTVLTDGNTVFVRSDGADFSTADLVVGARAQAKGKVTDGVLLASRVLIKVPAPEEEPSE